MVKKYKIYKQDNSEQAQRIVAAVDKAIENIKGTDKERAVMMVYINHTHTVDGAGEVLASSRRVIQKWLQEFTDMVGEYAGFS